MGQQAQSLLGILIADHNGAYCGTVLAAKAVRKGAAAWQLVQFDYFSVLKRNRRAWIHHLLKLAGNNPACPFQRLDIIIFGDIL